MASGCNPRGYDRMFNDRFARHTANRYRRRGLGKTARSIVDLVEQHGVQGASVLEVVSGVGEIQVELLKRQVGSPAPSASRREGFAGRHRADRPAPF
jgi:hypothetical protein